MTPAFGRADAAQEAALARLEGGGYQRQRGAAIDARRRWLTRAFVAARYSFEWLAARADSSKQEPGGGRLPLDVLDSAADPRPGPEMLVASHQLATAVASLPTRERLLVERHYYDGERFDVIARDLGISKSWASRLHDRALRSLRGAAS